MQLSFKRSSLPSLVVGSGAVLLHQNSSTVDEVSDDSPMKRRPKKRLGVSAKQKALINAANEVKGREITFEFRNKSFTIPRVLSNRYIVEEQMD